MRLTFKPPLMKIKSAIIFSAAIAMGFFLSQCKKTTETDTALFDKSKSVTGFSYYKNSDSIHVSSSPSAHNPYFRVRFNSIAEAALTDNGKLPVGGSFPDGSLIVKELYDSPGGSLQLLAVMEKASANSASGNGYLWAEFEPDGKAAFSTSKKGNGCISCHSATGNRDLVRLFELFP